MEVIDFRAYENETDPIPSNFKISLDIFTGDYEAKEVEEVQKDHCIVPVADIVEGRDVDAIQTDLKQIDAKLQSEIEKVSDAVVELKDIERLFAAFSSKVDGTEEKKRKNSNATKAKLSLNQFREKVKVLAKDLEEEEQQQKKLLTELKDIEQLSMDPSSVNEEKEKVNEDHCVAPVADVPEAESKPEQKEKAPEKKIVKKLSTREMKQVMKKKYKIQRKLLKKVTLKLEKLRKCPACEDGEGNLESHYVGYGYCMDDDTCKDIFDCQEKKRECEAKLKKYDTIFLKIKAREERERKRST